MAGSDSASDRDQEVLYGVGNVSLLRCKLLTEIINITPLLCCKLLTTLYPLQGYNNEERYSRVPRLSDT